MPIIRVQDLGKVYRIVEKDPATQFLNVEPGLLAWLSPVVALAIISYRVWLFGLKHCGGTGN